MRRLALLALTIITLTGCTPSEVRAWLAWNRDDPAAAQAWLVSPEGVEATAPAVRIDPPDVGRCAEWHDLAIEVGFAEADWPTVDRIMHRESRCQPGAYNPSGASGLMQIMPMWADDCGGSRADLLDPWFNLSCAVHILDVQGWRAWSTY